MWPPVCYLLAIHSFPQCPPAGIELGSGKPNKDFVGKVTKAQVAEIAKTKLPDTNATKLESVIRMIEGTAKNMGVKVVE